MDRSYFYQSHTITQTIFAKQNPFRKFIMKIICSYQLLIKCTWKPLKNPRTYCNLMNVDSPKQKKKTSFENWYTEEEKICTPVAVCERRTIASERLQHSVLNDQLKLNATINTILCENTEISTTKYEDANQNKPTTTTHTIN